jgi:hypothetical protein
VDAERTDPPTVLAQMRQTLAVVSGWRRVAAGGLTQRLCPAIRTPTIAASPSYAEPYGAAASSPLVPLSRLDPPPPPQQTHGLVAAYEDAKRGSSCGVGYNQL